MFRFPDYRQMVVVLLVLAGCGSGETASATLQSAQAAFDQAQELVESGDMPGALKQLEQAIAGPGLDADQYTAALLLRARCYCASDQLDRAAADVAEAELGSPDEALLHWTRGVLFAKQGKSKASKNEFSLAKKLDPSLRIPK